MNISPLSVNDLLAGCGFICADGCNGDYPIMAWLHLVQNDTITNEPTQSPASIGVVQLKPCYQCSQIDGAANSMPSAYGLTTTVADQETGAAPVSTGQER
ncbi:unnamed protein product [Urochloa humidicola]